MLIYLYNKMLHKIFSPYIQAFHRPTSEINVFDASLKSFWLLKPHVEVFSKSSSRMIIASPSHSISIDLLLNFSLILSPA